MGRQRFCVVGTGARAGLYVFGAVAEHRDRWELVGLCDTSRVRMAHYNRRLTEELGHREVAEYAAHDFERMLAEQRPDRVVVCTVDATHDRYICAALEAGCEVVTEKPMTTDAAKVQRILDTVERTDGRLRVTFNYRYGSGAARVRELVAGGAVGRPTAVDFRWVLDTAHGADYFRRWHREKEHSGGLLVHKSTHHFDLVNWWIDSWPQRVFALGALAFYGRENAVARGERYDYDRYTGVPAAAADPFAFRLDSGDRAMRELYLDAEAETGYLRDRNVFGGGITAEDTMSVTARYRSGVLLTYSLLAYAPWEGYRLAITGDRGRIELDVTEAADATFVGTRVEDLDANDPRAAAAGSRLRVLPVHGPGHEEEPGDEAGHLWADVRVVDEIFGPPDPEPDPLGRAATHHDGAASVLLGVAANVSIETGQPVDVDDLVRLPPGTAAGLSR